MAWHQLNKKGAMHVIESHEVETQEVFRDDFEGCLKHFAARFREFWPPGKLGLAKARKPIADFCSVSEQTIKNWLSEDGTLPTGEFTIKAECFLDLNGYRIIEFERLPKILRNIAELIGFGLLSGESAGERLGYSGAHSLYPVL